MDNLVCTCLYIYIYNFAYSPRLLRPLMTWKSNAGMKANEGPRLESDWGKKRAGDIWRMRRGRQAGSELPFWDVFCASRH